MEREPVDSSNIATIGYDVDSETLEIEFLRGGVYQYFDVPEQVYEDIISADSAGKYLNSNVKGVYRYSKI